MNPVHASFIPATLVYLFDGDRVLLMKRNKKEKDTHEGKYVGLGGKIEANESPLDCAIREVREESGLEVSASSTKFKGHIYCPKFDKLGRDWMVFVYSCFSFQGQLNSGCHEGELHWEKFSEVENLPMWEGDYKFFPYLKSDSVFDMTVRYDNDKLTDWSLHLV